MTHDAGNAAEGGSHMTGDTSVPPPPAGPGGRGRRGRPSVPGWVLAVALVIALVATAVTGALALTQRQEIERLRAELAEAEARVAELEARLAAAEAGSEEGLGRLLDELFGEGGGGLEDLLDGDLDGLLDGLLDGSGGLGELFSRSGGSDFAGCLAFPDARPPTTTGDEALAATGMAQDAVVVCAGDSLRLGISPDLATARRVAG